MVMASVSFSVPKLALFVALFMAVTAGSHGEVRAAFGDAKSREGIIFENEATSGKQEMMMIRNMNGKIQIIQLEPEANKILMPNIKRVIDEQSLKCASQGSPCYPFGDPCCGICIPGPVGICV
uniref:Uncharacterized protein n=1 Tax=Opuntia streptacantha TaxID=393608 RepID=A0A7C8ZZL9_OPUST